MVKALVLKELRETAGLAALGVLACAYALAALTGMQLLSWQPNPIYEVHVPFVDDKVLGFLAAIGSLLAVGLGLKQSAWESWQGTYIFLLHRPASRRAMFGTKLAVGAGLLLLVTGGMVLLYALWAARPGHHPSPFLWSMIIGAWRVWLSLPLLYLGAFLSGIRPARWFGSRLAPLAAAAILVPLAATVLQWWLGLVIVLLSAAVFVSSIGTYVDSRDY